MMLPAKLSVCIGAALAIAMTNVAAVECYDEVKIKHDLESKGYTVHESVTLEKMALLAYASDQEKRWMLFARPQQGMVEGAPAGEEMLCPLDGGEGGIEAMKQSPYYQKYFTSVSKG